MHAWIALLSFLVAPQCVHVVHKVACCALWLLPACSQSTLLGGCLLSFGATISFLSALFSGSILRIFTSVMMVRIFYDAVRSNTKDLTPLYVRAPPCPTEVPCVLHSNSLLFCSISCEVDSFCFALLDDIRACSGPPPFY